MERFDSLKEKVLDYLRKETEFIEHDIQNNALLPYEQKVEKGHLIPATRIRHHIGNSYALECEVNFSKFRPGDRVIVQDTVGKRAWEATIIENGVEQIDLTCDRDLPADKSYDIILKETVLTAPIISLLERLQEGMPGASFFKALTGDEEPAQNNFGALGDGLITELLADSVFNASQRDAIRAGLKRPSLMNIQGPPGTGKTDVLATLAGSYARYESDVIVLAPTHQAINNALNKIHKLYDDCELYKIGDELKALGLNKKIHISSYKAFVEEVYGKNSNRKKKGQNKRGRIVGMTFHAAVIHLGLQKQAFNPTIALVDEAGQLPLVYAAVLGTFRVGSVILIGDDKQMPPIYHQKLKDHDLSKSVFEYIRLKYPQLIAPLRITYRLNEQVTRVIDKLFYADGKEQFLETSSYSAKNRLVVQKPATSEWVNEIFLSPKSFAWVSVEGSGSTDYNTREASAIAAFIQESILCGIPANRLAVITPFRKQVVAIRNELRKQNPASLPVIDTVERLQGQDVDVILISFCANDLEYIRSLAEFLFNKNRINVMLSRAKLKVVIFANETILDYDRTTNVNILSEIYSNASCAKI